MKTQFGVLLCFALGATAVAGTLLATKFPVSEQTLPEIGSIAVTQSMILPTTAQIASVPTSQGKALYERKCGACHSVDKNRIGPRHRGVYGRRAGAVPGFRYSNALKKLNQKWDTRTLDSWLSNPSAVAPGTSMGFRLTKPSERKVIINYLKSISGKLQK